MEVSKVGVESILESIEDLERAVITVVKLAKSGGKDIGAILSLVSDLVDFAAGILGTLPEIKDLDQAESALLLTRLVGLVKKLFESLGKAEVLKMSPELLEACAASCKEEAK